MAKRKEGKSSRTSVLDIMNTDSSSFQGVDFDDAIKDLDKLGGVNFHNTLLYKFCNKKFNRVFC